MFSLDSARSDGEIRQRGSRLPPVPGSPWVAVTGAALLRRSSLVGSAVALALACGPAPAQGLEEIVVTAQRREQNIQIVPIAVSAFTAETLRGRGVTDVTSLSRLAPNVTLDASSPFSGDTSVLSA